MAEFAYTTVKIEVRRENQVSQHLIYFYPPEDLKTELRCCLSWLRSTQHDCPDFVAPFPADWVAHAVTIKIFADPTRVLVYEHC